MHPSSFLDPHSDAIRPMGASVNVPVRPEEVSESREELVQQVIRVARETLLLGEQVEVQSRTMLFKDLKFTSMDLLDFLFRLEDAFGISIPEGTLLRMVLGDLDERECVRNSILTPEGRDRLMRLLHDTRSEEFPERIHVSMLPQYLTVGAVARLVVYLKGGSNV